MPLLPNSAYLTDEAKLQHIAFRMVHAFPNAVNAKQHVPVNLLATHHQLKGDTWRFPCRVPLTHTSPNTTTNNETGNCYVSDPEDNCCDRRYSCK